MSIERVIFRLIRNATRASERADRFRQRQRAHEELQNAKIQAYMQKEAARDYVEQRKLEAENLNKKNMFLIEYMGKQLLHDYLIKDVAFSFQELKPTYNPPKTSQEKIHFYYELKLNKLVNFLENFAAKKLIKKIRLIIEIKLTRIKILENRILRSQKKEITCYNMNYRDQISEINALEIDYEEKTPYAINRYLQETLKKFEPKIKWDYDFEVDYREQSREAIINITLPDNTAIPNQHDYKYIKSKDEIVYKNRKQSEIEENYKYLICNIVLGTIYKAFNSDLIDAIDTVTVNGFVDTIDKSTGRKIFPCILSVCTTKEELSQFDLFNIDPLACIKGLKASISINPHEYVAIKPIRQIIMADSRFVKEQNILSSLDNRPNLMELDPFEFENLISNLFTKMGFDTRQTRSSRDGGVDAIVFDTRPLVGGKIVIQAKRYKKTVGVAAVRELYGTIINEGAKKGILVSTSGYGKDSFEFIKDKPIDLVDGNHLLSLLEEQGIPAKIIIIEESVSRF